MSDRSAAPGETLSAEQLPRHIDRVACAALDPDTALVSRRTIIASHELLRVQALAGERAVDALRRIADETYPNGWSRENCMHVARDALVLYEKETA